MYGWFSTTLSVGTLESCDFSFAATVCSKMVSFKSRLKHTPPHSHTHTYTLTHPHLHTLTDQVLPSDKREPPHLGYRGQTNPAGGPRGVWGRSLTKPCPHQHHLHLASSTHTASRCILTILSGIFCSDSTNILERMYTNLHRQNTKSQFDCQLSTSEAL